MAVGVHSFYLDTDFIVSDQIEEVILGMDWMNRHQCVLECGFDVIRIQDVQFGLHRKAPRNNCHKVVLQSDAAIPARAETLVKGKVVYSNLQEDNSGLWTTEPRKCADGLHSARGLIRLDSSTDLPVRVVNLTTRPIVLKEGTLLTSMVAAHSVADRLSAPEDSDRTRMRLVQTHIAEMTEKVHSGVIAGQRLQIEGLLFQYADILSCDETDLGRTDIVQHSIDTGDERPVRQQLRRTPIMHNQIIDENIDTMLKQGLI